MFEYFDKDFFKFLFGFVVIIIASCLVILAARVYQAGKNSTDTVVQPGMQTARSRQ